MMLGSHVCRFVALSLVVVKQAWMRPGSISRRCPQEAFTRLSAYRGQLDRVTGASIRRAGDADDVR